MQKQLPQEVSFNVFAFICNQINKKYIYKYSFHRKSIFFVSFFE